MITVKQQTRVTRDYRLELSGEQLRAMLPDDIPVNAEIYIQIPGGGDWSNTSLDITIENPVVITWKTVEESE